MNCPNCNAENNDKSSSCIKCSVPLNQGKASADQSNIKQEFKKQSSGGSLNFGDTGMIKDSNFHSQTSSDSHDQVGGAALGGSLDNKAENKTTIVNKPVFEPVVNVVNEMPANKGSDINMHVTVNVSEKRGFEEKPETGKETRAHADTQTLPPYYAPPAAPEKKKSLLIPAIAGGLVIVILAIGGFVLLSQKKDTVVQSASQSSTEQPRNTPKKAASSGKSSVKGGNRQTTETAVVSSVNTQAENAPLELEVNLLGAREVDKGNFEEVVLREGAALRSNDNFQIHLRATRDCYVYVLLFDSQGKAGMLFPGMAGSNNKLKANRAHQIPAGSDWFFLDEHTGTETVYVLAAAEPMTDIGRLLADMDRKGSRRQIEDSQKIMAQVNVMKRGVGGVTSGKTLAFKLKDGDTVQNVTQVVKGRGSLVWSVSFRHI